MVSLIVPPLWTDCSYTVRERNHRRLGRNSAYNRRRPRRVVQIELEKPRYPREVASGRTITRLTIPHPLDARYPRVHSSTE